MNAINLPHFHSGKVRDTYIPLSNLELLPVASDRVSTHNVTHKTLVPGKGELLTALPIFWTFSVLQDINTHLVAWGKKIYDHLPAGDYDPRLHYRAVIVRRLKPDPREFIWRNYLTGSLEAAYRTGKDPYGLQLPEGLIKMHHFPKAIYTPTEKSDDDDPVNSLLTRTQYPAQTHLTEEVIKRMGQYLRPRGVTIIDGKMETAGNILIDEWGTGDCCRMAFTKDIHEGIDPPWLDKQVFRDEAIRQWAGGPRIPLDFSIDVVENGVRRYHEAFEAIVGMSLSEFQHRYLD